MGHYQDKGAQIAKAQKAGILPALLKWRLHNGFPHQHMAATELVNGKYVEGKFEQGDNTLEKKKKH